MKIGSDMPFVCRLTAPLPSAIATLLLAGKNAYKLLIESELLKLDSLQIRKVYFCKWPIQIRGHTAYEHVVVCRTDEDRIEVSCHGGSAISNAIIESLVQHSFGVTEDWQAASCYSCQLQRQAEEDLIRAETDQVAAILLDQMNGSLSRETLSLELGLQSLAEGNSSVTLEKASEAEDSAQTNSKAPEVRLQERIEQLLTWSSLGVRLTSPWRVVLAGPPNVGKSSLLNAICGQQKALVHQEAGTTRDWISSRAVIEGWPVTITDTAGIRQAEDAIEAEGVGRARLQVEEADLLVLVVDATQGWTETHRQIFEADASKIIALNKADLVHDQQRPELPAATTIRCSAVGSPGIEELLESMVRTLVPTEPEAGQPIPFRNEQVETLLRVKESLRERHYEAAAKQLEKLRTG